MTNQSKTNDPRMWEKWKNAGAVETVEKAVVRQLAYQGDLKIYAIGEHYDGPGKGCSTLSLGERTVSKGPGWEITEPVLAVLVPGHNYNLGQELTKLPKGFKSLKEVFG